MENNKHRQIKEEDEIFSSVEPILKRHYPCSELLLEHTDKPDKIILVNTKVRIGVEITQIDSESHLSYFNPIHRTEKEFHLSIDENTPSTLIKKDTFNPKEEIKTIIKSINKKSEFYNRYKRDAEIKDCILVIYSQRFCVNDGYFSSMFSHIERRLHDKKCPFRYIFFCSSGLYRDQPCSLVYDKNRILRKKSNKDLDVISVEGKIFGRFEESINLDEISRNKPISNMKK